MSLLDVDSLDPEAGTLQRFGTDKDADFKFMPQELSARCRALIESYHAINGYARLPDMLWHSDARGVIECHPELARTFKTASKSRCAKRANGVFISIATFIASLEMLAGDFAGWGGRFPEAKREAEAYLAESTLQRRLWFIEKYLYPSHNAQRDLGEGLTPAAPDRY